MNAVRELLVSAATGGMALSEEGSPVSPLIAGVRTQASVIANAIRRAQDVLPDRGQ